MADSELFRRTSFEDAGTDRFRRSSFENSDADRFRRTSFENSDTDRFRRSFFENYINTLFRESCISSADIDLIRSNGFPDRDNLFFRKGSIADSSDILLPRKITVSDLPVDILFPRLIEIEGIPVVDTLFIRSLSIDDDEPYIPPQPKDPVDPYQPATVSNQYFSAMLDGISIVNNITSLSVSIDRESVHDSFEAASTDPALFILANENTNKGQGRLIVRFGSRSMTFLIEKRTGSCSYESPLSFSFSGRSVSAREALQFTDRVTISGDGKTMASVLAAGMFEDTSISWEIPDWPLPESFSFIGDRLEGLSQIAQSVEAAVRTDNSGNIRVVPYYPVVPKELDAAMPAHDLSVLSDITQLSFDRNEGNRYRAIEISGDASDTDDITIEVEQKESTDSTVEDGNALNDPDWSGKTGRYWGGNYVNTSRVAYTPVYPASFYGIRASGGFTYSFVPKNAYDAAWAAETDTVDTESAAEATGTEPLYIGDDVYVRVFCPDLNENLNSYVTDGKIKFVSIGSDDVVDTLTFVDGVATTSKPIYAVKDVEFFGATPAGGIDWESGKTNVDVSDDGYFVADITYETRFRRYLLYDHDVEKLLVAFWRTSENTRDLIITISDEPLETAPQDNEADCEAAGNVWADGTCYIGTQFADSVSDTILTTSDIKTWRGLWFLRKNKYPYIETTVDMPMIETITDGDIAYLNDAILDLSGNAIVMSVTFSFSNEKLSMNTRLRRILVP